MSSATCIECKSDIPDGLDLCPECGFHFADTPPIKCPECSNVVVFTGGVCPECGFPYDALEELLLEDEVDSADASVTSQAGQLPAMLKHAAAASAPQFTLTAPVVEGEGEGSSPATLSGEQVTTLEQLVGRIASCLEEIKNSKGSSLNDLLGDVQTFLEHIEQLKQDNQQTLQGMQEIAATFSSEMKGVVDGLNSAKASAITEVTAAKQGSSDAAERVSGTVDYIFYISLGIVLFTALNMVVTMYVIKLLK
ncbi:zinc ribbon domain-containing protein [Geomonas sp. RF6]|uniref:zinc ribbon domain-containing protein n=1 Tax=Geomonas sp. RF6 TaxID=2897342 RepID=UPI001E58AB66|nr:zinc ribbon domain-containing protein [Geomonas sp. RF6]UFS69819.1 zinc ribbon domain-containing protein [Geomonas sp. RF6]